MKSMIEHIEYQLDQLGYKLMGRDPYYCNKWKVAKVIYGNYYTAFHSNHLGDIMFDLEAYEYEEKTQALDYLFGM